jgi:hypothetical protein
MDENVQCSQCRKTIEKNKGFTVSYYKGSDEQSYRLCSAACVDRLTKHKKAEEQAARPGK